MLLFILEHQQVIFRSEPSLSKSKFIKGHRYRRSEGIPKQSSKEDINLEDTFIMSDYLKSALKIHPKHPPSYQTIHLIPESYLMAHSKELSKKLDKVNAQLIVKSNDEKLLEYSTQLKNYLYITSSRIDYAEKITILDLHPDQIAFQITLIEWSLFSSIHAKDFLMHSSSTPSPPIQASVDFFNYITRSIEYSILFSENTTSSSDASFRADHIQKWIKVASTLYSLQNFGSLKSVICALSTPPITRLKKTWSHVSKKKWNDLESYLSLMSEQDNYKNYREGR